MRGDQRLSLGEIADVIGVKVKTARNWVDHHGLRTVAGVTDVYVEAGELARFLDSVGFATHYLTIDPPTPAPAVVVGKAVAFFTEGAAVSIVVDGSGHLGACGVRESLAPFKGRAVKVTVEAVE